MQSQSNIPQQQQQPRIQVPKQGAIPKPLQKIQNNRNLNQNIYQLFTTNKYSQCLKLIDKCKPDEYKLYMKSLVLKNQYKLEAGLSLLIQCCMMNKLNYRYRKGIAKNFYLLGKYKSSLEAIKEAYKMNSSDYEIFYIMAKIQLALKDTESAISNLQKSLSKQPNEQSYILLAKIYMDKGKYREAEQQLKKSIYISPENDQIYYLLGEISIKLGDRKQAQAYFQASLDKDANKYQSLFSIAALKQAEMDLEAALQKYTAAYKITQNSSALWNNLAALMLKKNKQIVAYCCLKKSLFLNPFRYDIHINLGLLLKKLKKYVSAQMHFRTAIKLIKDNVSELKSAQIADKIVCYVYNLLGECLFELGDLSNAAMCFQEIFKIMGDGRGQGRGVRSSTSSITSGGIKDYNDIEQLQKYKINYLCVLFRRYQKELNFKQKQKCNKIIKQLQGLSLQDQQARKIQQIKSRL